MRLTMLLMLSLFSVEVFANKFCHEDKKKFCKEVHKGHKAKECLLKNVAKLSHSCKVRVEKYKILQDGCGEDYDKFCAAKKGTDLLNCMIDNHSHISKNCKEARKKIKNSPGPKVTEETELE